jgi:photosystem II stability/assembly factor-like uncharacterized protein
LKPVPLGTGRGYIEPSALKTKSATSKAQGEAERLRSNNSRSVEGETRTRISETSFLKEHSTAMSNAPLRACSFLILVSLFPIPLCAQGIVWKVQTIRADASFRGLYVCNDDVAWLCGGKGCIYKTIDRGESWVNCSPPSFPMLEFRSIYASDAQVAIAASAGVPAILLKTIDGGKSWKEVYRNDSPQAFFDALMFRNEKEGIAVSDPIGDSWLLVTTSDGGDTWHDIARNQRPASLKSEAAFAASNGSLAHSADGSIWLGTGGATGQPNASLLIGRIDSPSWSRIVTPLATGESSGIFAVDFSQYPRGIIVGGDYKKENSPESAAAYSNDGGRTWTQSTKQPSGFRSSVAFAKPVGKPGTFIAVGANGTDTSADGDTWNRISDVGFHAIRTSPSGHLWAVGSGGRVGRFEWK